MKHQQLIRVVGASIMALVFFGCGEQVAAVLDDADTQNEPGREATVEQDDLQVVQISSDFFPIQSLSDIEQQGAVAVVGEATGTVKDAVFTESRAVEDLSARQVQYAGRMFTLSEPITDGQVNPTFTVLFPDVIVEEAQEVLRVRDSRSSVERLRGLDEGTTLFMFLFPSPIDGTYFAYGDQPMTEVDTAGEFEQQLFFEAPSNLDEARAES